MSARRTSSASGRSEIATLLSSHGWDAEKCYRQHGASGRLLPPRSGDRHSRIGDSPIPASHSGDVGLGAWLLIVDDERIEINQLRIVLGKIAIEEPPAAVDMHQSLHASRVEIVDMLVPQRDRQ